MRSLVRENYYFDSSMLNSAGGVGKPRIKALLDPLKDFYELTKGRSSYESIRGLPVEFGGRVKLR